MLGKFQTRTQTEWMGLTSDNAIAMLGGSAPQKFSKIMHQMLGATRVKSLDMMFESIGTKRMAPGEEYSWDLIGSANVNYPLIEARSADGTVISVSGNMVGKGGDRFYLVFGKDCFAKGEIIEGSYNELYPIRVINEGLIEGTNVVYLCEMWGSSFDGIPDELLQPGELFSYGFAPVEEEGSRQVGDVRFNSHTSMRNGWTTIRLKHKVYGNKIDKKLVVGIPMKDKAGKIFTSEKWMHYEDWACECQWDQYKSNALAWARSNRNENGEYLNFGDSGNAIKTGDGMFAQLAAGNVVWYNQNANILKILEKVIYDLCEDSVGFADRQIIVSTGNRGAIKFHKAVLAETSGWTAFAVDNNSTKVIQRVASDLHNNALSAGFQFTEFKCPNGAIIKITVNPMYDDKARNKILHPEGGVAMSYRYDIMAIGSTEEPNMYKVMPEGWEDTRSYTAGIRNPFTGDRNVMNASTDEDATTFHRLGTFGFVIMDPKRCVSIIPNLLRA